MNPRAATVGVLFVVTLVASQRAAAQSEARPSADMPEAVRLDLSHCEVFPFDRSALVDVLRVELTTAGVELIDNAGATPRDGDDVALIFIETPECSADAREIEVRLVHVMTQQSAASTLEVTQASSSVQARIVALSVAELLRSSWQDLQGDSDAALEDSSEATGYELPGFGSGQEAAESEEGSGDEPVSSENEAVSTVEEEEGRGQVEIVETTHVDDDPNEQEPVPSENEAGGARTLGTVVDVLLDVRGFIGYGGAQIGGRAGASFMLTRTPLQLGFDAGGWYGVAFDPLGSVDIISATASISLLWTNRRSDINAGIGPRVELGWGRGAGRPDDDDTVWGESFDAFLSIITLRAVARFRLSRRVLILVDLQGGYVVSGIEARAADRRATGIGGPVIELGIGLSIEPSASQ